MTVPSVAPSDQTTTPMMWASLTHDQVLFNHDLDEHLVVSVRGAGPQHNQQLAVILAVDRSGSMAMPAVGRTSKLELVKLSLKHLAAELGEHDHLGLVGFDHEACVYSENVLADAAGKESFRRSVDALSARGNTNIEHALAAAIALAGELPRSVQVRIVLLTDGRANVGLCERSELCAVFDGLARNITVSTIGVGADCDHALLADLAELGGGGYGFVEHPGDVARVIGSELGSFIETSASNARLVLTPAKNVNVSCLEATQPGASDQPGQLVVHLGPLRCGVERSVVFHVHAVALDRPHVRPVSVAAVSLQCDIDGAAHREDSNAKVLRGRQMSAVNNDAAQAVERAQLSAATRQARAFAADGAYEAAAEVLNSVSLAAPLTALASTLAAGFVSRSPDNELMAASAYTVLRGGTLNGASARFAAHASNTLGDWSSDSQRYYGSTLANQVNSDLSAGGRGPRTAAACGHAASASTSSEPATRSTRADGAKVTGRMCSGVTSTADDAHRGGDGDETMER